MVVLRDYQQKAADAAIDFFRGGNGGGLIVIPTGGGKSHCIAEIARKLSAPILIFVPSKEILEQNHEKIEAVEKGISTVYSASVRKKKISMITFATIGSVMNHIEDFDVFRNIIVDECHFCNAYGGRYKSFLSRRKDRRVVGFTATPYRLEQAADGGSILRFLTRTEPRIFTQMLFSCQISDLLSKGYLAEVKYYDVPCFDIKNVRVNSKGSEYDDESLKEEYERSGFYDKLADITLRATNPKNGIPRKGILVFTRFTKEAEILVRKLSQHGVGAAIVTGDTPKREREDVLRRFKGGSLKVIANVNVLSVGFDFPELDTVILARPTKSLALYYQQTGRIIRPFKGKDARCIDLAGNYKRFGAVSDLKIREEKEGTERWAVFSKGRQLTNVFY